MEKIYTKPPRKPKGSKNKKSQQHRLNKKNLTRRLRDSLQRKQPSRGPPMKASGKLTKKEDIKEASTGTKTNPQTQKTEKWTLYNQILEVDGEKYSISGFNKDAITKITSSIQIGDQIEFQYKLEHGKYKNIDTKAGLKTVGVAPPVSATNTGNREKDIKLMRACFEDAKKACEEYDMNPAEIQDVACTFYIQRKKEGEKTNAYI